MITTIPNYSFTPSTKTTRLALIVLLCSIASSVTFSFVVDGQPIRNGQVYNSNSNIIHNKNGHQRQRRRFRCCTPLKDAATAFAVIDSVFQASPYAAGAIACGLKASTADLLAQKQQKIEQTDLQRNLAFTLYGSLYQGIAQEFLLNHVYPIIFGTGTGIGIVLIKVAFNLLIQATFVTLPIAYLTKALIYKYTFNDAIQNYIDDIRSHGLLKKFFLLWGPVMFLTFSIIPEHFRVTFIAFISFFWMILFSSIAGGQSSTSDKNK